MRENEPRFSSWFVLVMHRMGHSYPGSPLVFLHPIFLHPIFLHQATLSRPHPSGKGRGEWHSTLCVCACWWHWRLGPHPSKEGRGSLPGCSMRLRAKWGQRVVVGWLEDKQNSTMMGLMCLLNSDHRHRLCLI